MKTDQDTIKKAVQFYKDRFLILIELAEEEFPGVGEKAIFPAMEEYMWKLFYETINRDPKADIVTRMYGHFNKVKSQIEHVRPDLCRRSRRRF